MSALVPVAGKLPVEAKVQRELIRHEGRMQAIAEVAQVAMDEVSNVHSYATYKATTTMAAEEAVKKCVAEGNGLPADAEVALHQLRRHYLHSLDQITTGADARIVLTADRMPLAPKRGFWDSLRDAFGV